MDLKTLSPKQLETMLTKANDATMVVVDALIAAGRGHERFSETRTKTDPLSLEYIAKNDHEKSLRSEYERRMTYHGCLRRIK